MVIDDWNLRWRSDLTGKEVGDLLKIRVSARTELFARLASVAMRAF
jgi:hypothetical protein